MSVGHKASQKIALWGFSSKHCEIPPALMASHHHVAMNGFTGFYQELPGLMYLVNSSQWSKKLVSKAQIWFGSYQFTLKMSQIVSNFKCKIIAWNYYIVKVLSRSRSRRSFYRVCVAWPRKAEGRSIESYFWLLTFDFWLPWNGISLLQEFRIYNLELPLLIKKRIG